MPGVRLAFDSARLAGRAPQATAQSSGPPTSALGSDTGSATIATTPPPNSAGGLGSFTGTPTQLAESPPASSGLVSSTSDAPFFPSPTQTQSAGDDQSLERTKVWTSIHNFNVNVPEVDDAPGFHPDRRRRRAPRSRRSTHHLPFAVEVLLQFPTFMTRTLTPSV